MKVIAIDGPSGSGKSTISRRLATETNLPYLDTGATYRAVALLATRTGVDLADGQICEKVALEIDLELTNETIDGALKQRVLVNGEDVSAEIRTPEMSQAASKISVHPGVRSVLVQRQRDWVASHGGGVVEGRDIGSVVFPTATLKIFLTADAAERARRRQEDAHAPEFANMSATDAQKQLAERDHRDSNREVSPLQAVEDALVIDTSNKSIEDVVSYVLAEFNRRK